MHISCSNVQQFALHIHLRVGKNHFKNGRAYGWGKCWAHVNGVKIPLKHAGKHKLEMVHACLGIVSIVLDSIDLRRNWVGVWGVIGENCI